MLCHTRPFLSSTDESSPVGEPVMRNPAALGKVHGPDEKMNSWLFYFKTSRGSPGLGLLREVELACLFSPFPFAERHLLPLVGGYQGLLRTPD